MKLNQIFNLIIVAILLIAFGIIYVNIRSRLKTAENNLAASVKYHNQQIELSKGEVFDLYDEVDKLTQKLNLKPKQVVHYVKGAIQYRDTGNTTIIERPGDTIFIYPDSITGLIQKPCYDLNLLLYKGSFHEQLNYHDSTEIMLYRERPHKFLFIKYGRWIHKVAMYSTCRDTTYQVIDNIKVRGR